MDIKLDLKQLTTLFVQSAANEDLPTPIRQFAAQLTVLAAHVERVEAMVKVLSGQTDSHIAELANHILAVRQRAAGGTAKPQPAVMQPVADEAGEEDDGAAMAQKVMDETAAEVAALTRKNGEKKSPSVAPVASGASGAPVAGEVQS